MNLELDFRPALAPTFEQQQRRVYREKIPTPDTPHVHEIGAFWSVQPIEPAARNRLQALLPHLTPERMRLIVLPLVSGHSRLSMRALDWLVINYAKCNKLTLMSERGILVCVYEEYRANLRYWQRHLFDAFRRRARIFIESEGWTYSTTVGQLNYLYFCERMGVLHYAVGHRQEIETHMANRIATCRTLKRQEAKNAPNKKPRRCELSVPSTLKCQILDLPVRVRLDGPATDDAPCVQV